METKITRTQLITVVEALAELIDSWNDDAMDEDRGRDNNALCLLIWDDGSGQLGTQWGDVFNKQIEFDNSQELADQLAPWLDFAENEEVEALRVICQATRDTLGEIDDWLGMASTRQAAMDSMWRLSRMLERVGFRYDFRGALDWRGALVKQLNEAGFFNGDDNQMHYDPTAMDGKPYRIYGNAEGPTLKEFVEEYKRLKTKSQLPPD